MSRIKNTNKISNIEDDDISKGDSKEDSNKDSNNDTIQLNINDDDDDDRSINIDA